MCVLMGEWGGGAVGLMKTCLIQFCMYTYIHLEYSYFISDILLGIYVHIYLKLFHSDLLIDGVTPSAFSTLGVTPLLWYN